MDLLTQWLDESPGSARTLAQETLILDATEEIWAALNHAKLSKTDLAALLNVSKPRITRLLDGSANMTLRTLADIAFELGKKVTLQFENKEAQVNWTNIRHISNGLTFVPDRSAARSGRTITNWQDVNDTRFEDATESIAA